MKTSSKIALIISGILFIGGCTAAAVGAAMVNFNFSNFKNHEYTQHTMGVTQSFEKLDVYTVDDDVIFLKSDDNTCIINYYDSDKTKYNIDCSDNTLSIKEEGHDWFNFNLFGFSSDHSVEIYLPEKEYEILTLTTVSGDVSLKKDSELTFKEQKINTTSGEVNFFVNGKKGYVETVSGDVLISGKTDSSFDVNTVSGDISLTDLNCGTLSVNTTSGDTVMKKTDAKEISVKSVSGDITGEIIGKKDININTVSGDINIPQSFTGEAKLNIETVSGDIKLA